VDDYYGYSYSNKPGDHDHSKTILKHKDRIKELKNSGLLSKAQKQEIEELENKIAEIRNRCIHDYQPVILAQYRRKYCTKCDQEDYNYDYRKD
jgi:hypothetical protein